MGKNTPVLKEQRRSYPLKVRRDAPKATNKDIRDIQGWILQSGNYNVGVILVASIIVSPSSANLNVNGTLQLTAAITPSNATNLNVDWSVTDSTIASVTAGGIVTALKLGSTTIRATSKDGNNTSGTTNLVVTTPIQPCLLEGTTVKTTSGYKPIESIQVGDEVISHLNRVKKVLKVGKWDCYEKTKTLDQTLYKIPKGKLHAKEDVFLTRQHKIVYNNWLKYPESVGFKKAKESEYTKNGKYTVYHVQIEDGRRNFLDVNGGCFVESWIVDY